MDAGLKIRLENDQRSFDGYDLEARVAAIEVLVEGITRTLIQDPEKKVQIGHFVMNNIESLYNIDEKEAAGAMFSWWRAIRDSNQG
ncbi:hypothetical protein [Loktanella salsilacus]|uniref:hypothetical protein n=1 Tax=Loktanella salsilacus TaxID=195913 RepID=UPI00370442D7